MYRRWSCFLLLLLLSSWMDARSQTEPSLQPPKDTTAWSHYAVVATFFSENNQQDSAAHFYRLALSTYPPDSNAYLKLKGEYAYLLKSMGNLEDAKVEFLELIATPAILHYPDKAFTLRAYQNLAVVYSFRGNYDQSIGTCLKAVTMLDSLGLANSGIASDIFGTLGVNYAYLSIFDDAIQYMERSLLISQQQPEPEEKKIATAYNNLGVINKWLGNLERAEHFYELSMEMRVRTLGEHHPELADIYGNIGTLSMDRGMLERALHYQTLALEIREKNPEGEVYKLAGIYNNIALIHFYREELEEALKFSRKSIELYIEENIGDHPTRAEKYGTLANIYREQHKYEAAIQNFEYSNSLIERQLSKQDRIRVLNLIAIGELYRQLNKPEEAKDHFEKALEVGKAIFGNKHPKISHALRNLAQLEIDQSRLEQGEIYLRLANESNTLRENQPNAERSIISAEEYMEIINGKIAVLIAKFRRTPEDEKIPALLVNTMKEGDQVIDQLSRRFFRPQDRFVFQKQVASYYQTAVNHCYTLYAESENIEMVDLALFFMEKSRFNVFMFQSMDENYFRFDQIPDSLVEKEKSLKINIGYYESKIVEQMATQSMDSVKYQRYQAKLIGLAEQYQTLVKQFEKQHHAYFQLRYQASIPDISTIQKFLKDQNAAITSYFLNEDFLFSIYIAEGEVRFLKTEITPDFRSATDQFIQHLHTPDFTEYGLDDMRKKGEKLYQVLLGELLTQTSKQKLIVIPSGRLTAIPFEVLSRKDPDRSYRYVIEDYTISYASSAAALLHRSQPTHDIPGQTHVLAVAPFGESGENGQSATLKWSEKEVNAISEYFTTEKLTGQQATESNFRQQLGAYSILHIASHGELNDLNPMHTRLRLVEEDRRDHDGSIYVGELYGLKLPAELVVLSSCDTGAGKILAGEGAVSLAKGFFYAGAKTVVMSLWKANDKSSYSIMKDFYQHLASGINKAESLRMSKLIYLKQAKGFEKHPHFWAQFVVSGDTNPLPKSAPLDWGWSLVIAIAVVGVPIALIKTRPGRA